MKTIYAGELPAKFAGVSHLPGMTAVRCVLLLSLSFVIGLVVATGCNAPTAKNEPETVADVKVEIGSAQEFQAMLDASKGKVILVDFWSTSCGPCVENFPHTVELSNKYRDQGLATIAVSMDDPDNMDAVKGFLGSQKDMNIHNLLSRDGMSQKSAVAFDFGGALPHYRLYDRAGKLVESWDGLPEDLEAKIQELLAAQ